MRLNFLPGHPAPGDHVFKVTGSALAEVTTEPANDCVIIKYLYTVGMNTAGTYEQVTVKDLEPVR